MADIFLSRDLRNLLVNKKVVFMGDSNIRAIYKDILCLCTGDDMISRRILRAKMENSVFGDKLVHHGEKTNSRGYTEERLYNKNGFHFSFFFLTRVFNEYVESVLKEMMRDKEPDVIIINSCLWDICRWGPKGVEKYKPNLVKFMKKLNAILSPNCLVVWITAPPLSQNIQGGFLVVQLEFLKYCLRFHVMEANHYARKVVVAHGYDVLDIHYHLRMQLQRRCSDGVHWISSAVRYITNLLLTHISLAWGVPLPHRYDSIITRRASEISKEEDEKEERELAYEPPETESDCAPTPPIPFPRRKKARAGGNSYQAFTKKERQNRSRRNIRTWGNNYCPSPPRRLQPSFNHEPRDDLPYRFCAPPQRSTARNAASHFSSSSNFDFSDLPSNCRF